MPRRRSATLQFNAIRLVGGLLPASLIDQIARPAGVLGFLRIPSNAVETERVSSEPPLRKEASTGF